MTMPGAIKILNIKLPWSVSIRSYYATTKVKQWSIKKAVKLYWRQAPIKSMLVWRHYGRCNLICSESSQTWMFLWPILDGLVDTQAADKTFVWYVGNARAYEAKYDHVASNSDVFLLLCSLMIAWQMILQVLSALKSFTFDIDPLLRMSKTIRSECS